MLILYAATVFTGAGLLFAVQPMVARMVLPLLGGAPAVWSTVLVFFQAVLLAGYAYAHFTVTRLGLRRQVAVHLALLLVPLAALPIAVPAGWSPPPSGSPIPWLLALLAVAVGPPVLALAASAPVLQAWLVRTGHRRATDPYPLYAASNLGSLVALLGYPVVLEPTLPLAWQSRLWAIGYAAFVLLVLGSARALRRAAGDHAAGTSRAATTGPPAEAWPTAARRARWGLLALVPSSLLVSVTAYGSTDIAAIPLLWVVPLALYLLTFVLAFARRPPLSHRLMLEILPLVMVPLVFVLAVRANEPLAVILPTHLLAFFVAALVCHGELARDRPSPGHLTAFYLAAAAGGAVGGAVTTLAAPLLFRSVAEYPLMLVLACLLPRRPDAANTGRARALDVALPLALAGLAVSLLDAVPGTGAEPMMPGGAGLVLGGLALACLTFARRPVRFGLGVGAVLVAATLRAGAEGRVVHAERSFFGVSRVTDDPSGQYRLLLHGTTLHGMQSRDPARRLQPLAYFDVTGPLGQVFAAIRQRALPGRVAVVGLGAGAIACYGRPGQRWVFYEIDPVVDRIARDGRFFTYLRDCPPAIEVVLGDARLSLARAPDGEYDLIVLDAYSSDAPPMHLLTREAVRLFRAKLAPGGMLAFNATNRHLDLAPALAAVGRALGLAVVGRADDVVPAAAWRDGKRPSRWVVMAREPADLGPLAAASGWLQIPATPGVAPWTDDFASLLSAFRGARPFILNNP